MYEEHEKLDGPRNYKSWIEMIRLDLNAAYLSPFVDEENAKSTLEIPTERRNGLDAQAIRIIKASLSKKVLATLQSVNSAFEVIKCIRKSRNIRYKSTQPKFICHKELNEWHFAR